jgi:hypothetical protein
MREKETLSSIVKQHWQRPKTFALQETRGKTSALRETVTQYSFDETHCIKTAPIARHQLHETRQIAASE